MAWMSSLEASPSCTLLMMASSALRCFGFLEQALRLVEEAGVLQRHAHGIGQGFDQPYI